MCLWWSVLVSGGLYVYAVVCVCGGLYVYAVVWRLNFSVIEFLFQEEPEPEASPSAAKLNLQQLVTCYIAGTR